MRRQLAVGYRLLAFALGIGLACSPTPTDGGGGTPPTTPTGLTVTTTTVSSVSLSWNAATGATSYQLYRDGTQVYSSSSTNYNDTGLGSGTTYQYAVRATNSTGSSGLSSPVSATTVALAHFCFWSNDGTDGNITVYVDGSQVGQLTQYYLNPSTPSCASPGTLVVTGQPGSHTISAQSQVNGQTWGPATVTLASGEQLLYQFTVTQFDFWTNRSDVGSYINVYLNGILVAQLTSYFNTQPSWGASGTKVVTVQPGTYTIHAISQGGTTWDAISTLTSGQQVLYKFF
jgi:hypothetical protein